MPKNKGKGGKNRRRGKNEADNEKRELIFKEDSQEYARVLKMLGNGRVRVKCLDVDNGKEMIAHIRGKMRKKVWINQGDVILLSLRDYQADMADVIQKYTPDEARALVQYGELPDSVKINDDIGGPTEEGENAVHFGEIDEDDEDSDSDDSDAPPPPPRGKAAKKDPMLDIDDI